MKPAIEPEQVRLAIIGVGTIGTIHGLCSLQVPEAKVTAVWSRSIQKAMELAETLGATAHADVESAADDPNVDAVLVCTPTFLHRDHALMAIEAGKHVICEKPLARDLTQARDVIGAAERAGVALYVAHVVRFFPEFRQLHDLVLEGKIGRPALVRMSRVSAFPRGSDDWQSQPDASGGVALDMGIHDLDWLLWTFGPASRVYARGLTDHGLRCLDYALLTIRMQSGVIAHVECSWAERDGFAAHGEISGDAGLLAYDSRGSTAMQVALRETASSSLGVNVPTSYTVESPYVLQLQHLTRCILGLEEPIMRASEAYASLDLALCALQAIKLGESVRVGKEARL